MTAETKKGGASRRSPRARSGLEAYDNAMFVGGAPRVKSWLSPDASFGMLLQSRAPACREVVAEGPASHVLLVVLDPAVSIEVDLGGQLQSGSTADGSVFFVPAGTPSRWTVPSGQPRCLHLHFSEARLRALLTEEGLDATGLVLRPIVFGASEAFVSIARRVEAEFRRPDAYTPFSMRGLGLEFAVHLIRKLSNAESLPLAEGRSLTTDQLFRAIEIILDGAPEAAGPRHVSQLLDVSPLVLTRGVRDLTGHEYGDWVARLKASGGAASA